MSHSVKRSKSQFEQFRMAVPEDVQAVVGKTAWTKSLRTTDKALARLMRADLVAKYSGEIISIRAAAARQPIDDAIKLVDRAFSRLAHLRGSMDTAIAQQLQLLADVVCGSWKEGEPEANAHWLDGRWVYEPAKKAEAVPALEDAGERSVFLLRAEIIEGRGIADGLVYQELARTLLRQEIFRPISFAASYLFSVEPELRRREAEHYDVIAETYLRRLSEHRFACWPSNIHQAFNLVMPAPEEQADHHPPSPVATPPARLNGLLAMSITEACRYWEEQRRPSVSAVTEARRSVARFAALFGDRAVGHIDRPTLVEFRNLVADIPPQTELAKLEASGRTLRAVIDDARERRHKWEDGPRDEPAPDRLAPASVKKELGALSQILGKVHSDLGTGVNIAAGIEIAGYSKTRSGQKRPRLPLTPAMMQKLFDSPLFTGCAGQSDRLRSQPGPHVIQDELYWPFLFGVVGGPRLREIGQIALSDVHRCDLARTFGREYRGQCTYIHITGSGDGQSVKNDASERYVVIHDRLIELGFDDYVAGRRAAGKTTLFDLPSGRGSPTKGLSQRLNRYIDQVVTTDDRYVFHSTRHEFTDRAELSEIPARVANSIKGHAHGNVADRYGLVSILAQHLNLRKLKLDFIDWDRLIEAARRQS